MLGRGRGLAVEVAGLVPSPGTFTPIDASGAGLVLVVNGPARYVRLGNVVTVWFSVTYPVTADASAAAIDGLPFAPLNIAANRGTLSAIVVTSPHPHPSLDPATGVVQFYGNGVLRTNAQLSGLTVSVSGSYLVA